MIKKIMSLAVAICMVATALLAVNVAAQEITGDILPYDTAGNPKSTFFSGERVCFMLEYKLDGYYAGNAWFYVHLEDIAGNLLDAEVWIVTPTTDIPYRSWPGTGFDIPGVGIQSGVFFLKAWFANTSQLMFTNTVTIIQENIEITPEQGSYAPGQTIGISVTQNYDDDINVTIEKDGQIFQKWVDEDLTNFMWNGSWTIPGDAPTGTYTIWVNRSDNNVTLALTTIVVEFFTFDIFKDKSIYLPGETAVISWIAKHVPDMIPMDVAIDFNMSYRDAFDGIWKWQNDTFTTNPFEVIIPANANEDIGGDDIQVDVTAHTTYNQTSYVYMGIELEGLDASVSTDAATYSPGELILVTVQATTGGAPVADAEASVVVYDNEGFLVSGMALSNLTTDKTGNAYGTLTVPASLEAGDIIIVVTMTKLAYSDSAAVTVTIDDNWDVEVLVEKTAYVAGETIDVTVNVWQNGVAVDPDSIEYWLGLTVGVSYPHQVTYNTSFTIVAPGGIDSMAVVNVIIISDAKEHAGSSSGFWITPLVVELGVNTGFYYAGDTVTFSVKTLGDTTPFEFSYSIWDANSLTVESGALTINTNGEATFALDVPDDTPSSQYTARVIADNGAGYVVSDELTVLWRGEYVLDVSVRTGPAYSSGGFAPGQTLTIGFVITKTNDNSPDLTLVSASVELFAGEPFFGMFGNWIADGQSKTIEGMSGEVTIVLPKELTTGAYTLGVFVEGMTAQEVIQVNADGNGWDSSVGGLSASDLLLAILMIIVILMLIWMMMKGGAAAAGLGAKKPEAPKEAPKQEQYSPKATVKCSACGAPIEVATSKRPIEVMCPKCGTSQVIS